MSDLISRKALMRKIVEYDIANLQSPNRGTIVDVVDSISEMVTDAPTAYDIEAVEQLCKAGDTVYQVDESGTRIYESAISRIIYDTDGVAFDERAIGKTVFLTHEEAEAKLAEKSEVDKKVDEVVRILTTPIEKGGAE